MVFFALLEYALLLLHLRKASKEEEEEETERGGKGLLGFGQVHPQGRIKMAETVKEKKPTSRSRRSNITGEAFYRKIDTLALILFPGVFAIFNVNYWLGYLKRTEETNH